MDATKAAGLDGARPRPRTKVGDLHDDAAEAKPSYKSWKKKYRKMRHVFDQKMADCEELHRQELKAQALIKRLAIENDRILDLLYDNNECSQIPPNKRINLALPESSDAKEYPELDQEDMDSEAPTTPPKASFQQLLAEVPHTNFADMLKLDPQFAQDVAPLEGEAFPPSFLSADDMDNYLYELDLRVNPNDMGPTMAPAARAAKLASATGASSTGASGASNHGAAGVGGPGGSTANPSSRDFALKNPISVYNWLRKHAPDTFLQDGEAGGDDGPGDGRKARGGAKGERGGKAAKGTKKASIAAAKGGEREQWDADEEDLGSRATPAKGKRKRDDDPGYRPKGGTGSRPAKKKRKSDGPDAAATPTPNRRIKKEAHRDD